MADSVTSQYLAQYTDSASYILKTVPPENDQQIIEIKAFQGELIWQPWLLINFSQTSKNFYLQPLDGRQTPQGLDFQQPPEKSQAFGKLTTISHQNVTLPAQTNQPLQTFTYIYPEKNLSQKTQGKSVHLIGAIWYHPQADKQIPVQIAKTYPFKIQILPSNYEPLLIKWKIIKPFDYHSIEKGLFCFSLMLIALITASLISYAWKLRHS